MENGKVKFYNKEKKFGFIAGDDGDNVEFKTVEGDRGPKAIEISQIN